MIYLDYGATSLHKPPAVLRAVETALRTGGNAGRGGYGASMQASRWLYDCREEAARLFHCRPEQAAMTFNCTHGLNIAIRTLVKPGAKVAVSGFEHNAVMRPLYRLGADITVAGRRLFDWDDTLESFRKALKKDVDAAVFTHVSNVFGYILPVEQLAALCREQDVPFIVDAAQSAGVLPVDFAGWGADFIAMPGHKGLLGPQGTGLLLCGQKPEPLLLGGTGSQSLSKEMPEDVPERIEAGTQNTPGVAGLTEGLRMLSRIGTESVRQQEAALLKRAADGLERQGWTLFRGEHQISALSILPPDDRQDWGELFARQGIAVRAGLHCAPLAHESAATTATGTVRLSFGWGAAVQDVDAALAAAERIYGEQERKA